MSDETPGEEISRDEQVEAILGVATFLQTIHEDKMWDQVRTVWANPMVCTPSLFKAAMDAGSVYERLALTRYRGRGYIVVMEQPKRVERDPAQWLKPRERPRGKPGKRK